MGLDKLTSKEMAYYTSMTMDEKVEQYQASSLNNRLADRDVMSIKIDDDDILTTDRFRLSRVSSDETEKDFVLSFEGLIRDYA